MTLTELRYVAAVARERHFGRAAAACFVSQPTLSVAVRKLEGELGVRIFERRSSEVTVTPAGEAIVAQARRVLAEAQALRELASERRDPLKGVLRVGLIHTIGPYLLPELIPLLRERAPNMPLVIEEGYTAELRKGLVAGALDLIIISLPFRAAGIRTRAVYEEPFVVLLPAAHPWNQRTTIDPADLAQENLLLLGPGHCFRDQVLDLCPECRRSDPEDGAARVSLEGGSLETIRHMVVSGMGITVAPATAAGADRYSQRLLAIRRFQPPVPRRRVAVAWRASHPRPQAVECVIESVLDCPLSGVRMLRKAAPAGSG